MAAPKGNKFAKGGPRPGSGRPPDWLKAECQKHAPNLIKFLLSVANGENVEPTTVTGADGTPIKIPAAVRDRIKATEILLDRGYGKVLQPISGEGGSPVTVKVVNYS